MTFVIVVGTTSQKTCKDTIKIAYKQKKSQKVEFSCDFMCYSVRLTLFEWTNVV